MHAKVPAVRPRRTHQGTEDVYLSGNPGVTESMYVSVWLPALGKEPVQIPVGCNTFEMLFKNLFKQRGTLTNIPFMSARCDGFSRQIRQQYQAVYTLPDNNKLTKVYEF